MRRSPQSSTSAAGLLICCAVLLSPQVCHAGTPLAVRFLLVNRVGKPQQFHVSGLSNAERERFASLKSDSERQTTLSVSIDRDNASAMLGSYSTSGKAIVFEPRFPLRKGESYRVVWKTKDGDVLRESFAIAESKTPPPEVTNVFPSEAVLPENQLKFYLHFSQPMQQGNVYQYIHLIDEHTNEPVDTPFLQLGEELWDRSGTRLTLYFDPGRIKRGLQPREIFGPTLEAGNFYRLVIDREWTDIHGHKLTNPHIKRFRAASPDDECPKIGNWRLDIPRSGTNAPLVVRFREPLDHAMLQRVLVITDSNGKVVQGEVKIQRAETLWQFTPTLLWKDAGYKLTVDTTLEDRSGNSLARPFEVDVFREVTKEITTETVFRDFNPGSPTETAK